jgi:hypothetical protein
MQPPTQSAIKLQDNHMLGTGEEGVLLREKGLDVPLPDGRLAYFNYYWLKDNEPASFDPETRERVNDIFALAEEPKAQSAAIAGDHLEDPVAGHGASLGDPDGAAGAICPSPTAPGSSQSAEKILVCRSLCKHGPV